MAKIPNISSQINLTVKEIWSRFPPALSNLNKGLRKWANTEVSVSKGKKFILNKINQGILATILKGEKGWLATFLKVSELTESELSATFKEMELRFEGKSPAFQTWKGTFVEVLFVKTKRFRDLEERATVASLESALIEVLNNEASFYGGGQNTKDLSTVLGININHHDIPWRSGQETLAATKIAKLQQMSAEVAKLQGAAPTTKSGKIVGIGNPERMKWINKVSVAQEAVDLELAALRAMINPRAMEVALDMAIDGALFVDRAVLLKLKSGKRILLVSTEFKNYTTRGAWAQQAKRNTRVFEVKPQSEISYVLETRSNGVLTGFRKISINAEDLHINATTESSDRMLINLTRKTEGIEGSVAVTPRREVREALGLRKRDMPKSQAVTNVFQIEWSVEGGIEPLLAKLFAAIKG